ncbi:DUF2062 domain-containing protein [Oscillatoria sp. CS-180]|uniref:DUF2062 domain-containing protein n=1 Tax=Oscillatoria sp. CS-180 TaxID=3021720 RepID=UPI00232CCE44|nr:DUF2062 domain-containing protein [Oscillatoria sp. CS-180]MDB9524626.1 DUF2062 domain-containing protein [Oscillatoria sp. CS-180]
MPPTQLPEPPLSVPTPQSLSRKRQRSLNERIARRTRYIYLRFIRLRGHPKELARGLAAGVFAGMFPLFGLQTIIGVAIALRIKGNPLLAAGGTWISNPLTYLPIYAFNYQLGSWILRRPAVNPFTDVESLKSWVETGADVGISLMLGSLVMGLIFGILSYFLGLPLIRRAQKRYRKLQRGREQG